MGVPGQKKACEICSAIFRVWPCLENRRKYCSRACQAKAISIQAHKERLIRLELIRNGADLPIPRRSAKYKHVPDYTIDSLGKKNDDIPDPDEPTPEEQEEITKSIKLLQENRRSCENKLDTAFHKKSRK